MTLHETLNLYYSGNKVIHRTEPFPANHLYCQRFKTFECVRNSAFLEIYVYPNQEQ